MTDHSLAVGESVRTIAQLHALPERTILLDRMGWVSVLTDDILPDARGAYMTNLEGVRTVWKHTLPALVVYIPD